MRSKVTDDRTTFKPIGPIVRNIVRRIGSKLDAQKKDRAHG